jgi:putative Mg2+ transporter-C (MgtC) family protein
MTLAVIDTFDNAIRDWGVHQSWPFEYMLRLVLAAVAGGLVGIEREVRGRQAGFRTNLLVSVGCALVVLVSVTFASRAWPHSGEFNVNVDPARVAYGIMAGIGFLGAGTIMKNDGGVRGLTTAAAMWCVAGMGMAAGLGMYTLTVVTTAIVVGSLWILDYVEREIPHSHTRVIVIRRAWGADCIRQTIERLKRDKMRVLEVNYQRTDDLKCVDISMRASFKNKPTYYALEKQLEADADLELMATREE